MTKKQLQECEKLLEFLQVPANKYKLRDTMGSLVQMKNFLDLYINFIEVMSDSGNKFDMCGTMERLVAARITELENKLSHEDEEKK